MISVLSMQPSPAAQNKLIPKEATKFFPRDEQFIITSKEKIRIIFGGKIEFSDDEKKKIAEFKDAVKAQPEAENLKNPV